MNLLNQIGYILTIVAFNNCTNCSSREDQTSEKIITVLKQTPVSNFRADKEESFNNFFKKFESSQSFQIYRISFPLTVEHLQDDVESKRIIQKRKWHYTDFHKN
ncbi:DUF4348 domain-containing protein [Mucilaginibacter litoreus]|uniref:DUF4348 domain-containing protein n=1 Tax=Mucilaginibacter litoreus TaxID=1048221 RepID=A0ABW3AQF9_9SPHI